MGAEPFETIVGAHHGEIYRYLRRVTSRTAEAEDLSQETFLRAYRAYRTLGPDANVRAWLFAIATNLSRNHFRSEKRRRVAHQAVSVENREADPEGPEDEVRFGEARTGPRRRGDGRRRARGRTSRRAAHRLVRRLPRRVSPLSRDRGRRGRAPARAGGGGRRGARAAGTGVEARGPAIAPGVLSGV